MGLYIYSSALRRSAKEILEASGTPLTVAIMGERPLEALLFRNVATAIVSVEPGDTTNNLASSDFILCGTSDLQLLTAALLSESKPAEHTATTVNGIAVRGSMDSLSSTEFEVFASICDRLNLTLVAQQAEATAFGHGREIVFVFARMGASSAGEPLGLLKIAVFLEAHSLHETALKLLALFNEHVTDPSQMIDPAIVDRTYEVAPFAGGSSVRAGQSSDGASDLQNQPVEPRETADGRILSIHFDQLHRDDGKARLLRLARSLALPELAEIIVRVPGPVMPTSWATLAAEIEALGVAVNAFLDPALPREANPSARGFLAATAPEARIAVYYGEHEPVGAGWDYDLHRAANAAEGKRFAFRISDHKTRNYCVREDAEIAPESMPAVSRAWLETCEVWSEPGVPAGVFQSLVAFYFDRADWTNKHRALRLYPVMTLSTRPVEPAEISSLPTARRRAPFRIAAVAAQKRAIEIALKLHAIEWSELHGIDDLRIECAPERRRLVLRAPVGGKISKSWVVPLDRSRLPL
jgi:hypothetical protein